jgi:hypothetical protein
MKRTTPEDVSNGGFPFEDEIEQAHYYKPFVTGTSAYGPFTNDSDIDIVMMYYDADRLRSQLVNAGVEVYEPNREVNKVYKGFEFMWLGRKIQIICVESPDHYEDWLEATREMQNTDIISRRDVRLKVFENFRQEAHSRRYR